MDKDGQTTTIIIVSILGGLIFVTLLVCVLYFCIRHRQKEMRRRNFANVGVWGDDDTRKSNDGKGESEGATNVDNMEKIKEKDKSRMKSRSEATSKKKRDHKKESINDKEGSKKEKKNETAVEKSEKKKGKKKKEVHYLSLEMPAGVGKSKKTTSSKKHISHQQKSLPTKQQLSLPEKEKLSLPAKVATLPLNKQLVSLPPLVEKTEDRLMSGRPVKATASGPLSLPARVKSIKSPSPEGTPAGASIKTPAESTKAAVSIKPMQVQKETTPATSIAVRSEPHSKFYCTSFYKYTVVYNYNCTLSAPKVVEPAAAAKSVFLAGK